MVSRAPIEPYAVAASVSGRKPFTRARRPPSISCSAVSRVASKFAPDKKLSRCELQIAAVDVGKERAVDLLLADERRIGGGRDELEAVIAGKEQPIAAAHQGERRKDALVLGYPLDLKHVGRAWRVDHSPDAAVLGDQAVFAAAGRRQGRVCARTFGDVGPGEIRIVELMKLGRGAREDADRAVGVPGAEGAAAGGGQCRGID